MRRFAAILGAALIGLAGCASDPARLPLGASRAEALQQLGAPTAIYPRPGGGERLQYSRQPAGFEVNDVDLGADGRVVAVTQAMNDAVFAQTIRIDAWRVTDVLYTFGRPEQVTRVSSFDGDVWQWRYLQANSPRLLYIYIDPQGVVRRWHTGDDLRFVPGNLNGDRN
ncbi:MAG: hypothetical protein JSR41_21300 [Proteobacteria bacterium]|nr:hypothetical protein [Pseudomonadota bacterium]